MARCESCLKSGQSGNNVSHSKRRTRTHWSANVQTATILVGGGPKRMKLCTRCLRTHYKTMMKG